MKLIMSCPILFEAGGCFAKGTLVHTKEGLRPIEEIKVGDYVLSSPEDGTGSQEYKRVVQTFVHENKTIRDIGVYGEKQGQGYFVDATDNHPFWVEGKGWTRADLLKKNNILRKFDGTKIKVAYQYHVYRTGQPGVGWVQNASDVGECTGSRMDYENCDSVADQLGADYLSKEVYESENPYLEVTVYNLEVEDFHTYFVTPAGLWVHNFNCG
jgi:Pretoxin HINT domain